MGGVVALGGLMAALSGHEAYEAWRGDQSVEWPTAPAVVVGHDVSGGGRRHYYAVVKYEYVVDGHTYRCDRVRYQQPSDGRTSRDSETYAKANFPIGATFDAHYDPDSPSRAVLIAAPGDWRRVGRITIIIALAAVVVGLVSWVKRWLE